MEILLQMYTDSRAPSSRDCVSIGMRWRPGLSILDKHPKLILDLRVSQNF